jgi:hypothetical protein
MRGLLARHRERLLDLAVDQLELAALRRALAGCPEDSEPAVVKLMASGMRGGRDALSQGAAKIPRMNEIMTPAHPRWHELVERLGGPRRVRDWTDESWRCGGGGLQSRTGRRHPRLWFVRSGRTGNG